MSNTTSLKEFKKKELQKVYEELKKAVETKEQSGIIKGRNFVAAENILKECPTWEKFFKTYAALTSPSLHGVFGKYHNRKRKRQITEMEVDKAIKLLSTWITFEGTWRKEHRKALEKLRVIFEREVPLDTEVHDMNYIKYYDCCCCGEPSPPGGHTLAFVKMQGWKYPICDKCLGMGRKPDMGNIAEMYYKYALTIEHILDRI